MGNYKIQECAKEDKGYINDKLVGYNFSQVPLIQGKYIDVSRKIVDKDGNIIAGLLGAMYWECMYIEILWVDENYRMKGLGSRLLNEVEKFAKENECHLVHLDTFDFQAKDFYLKHGYEIFGVLDDCPIDHKRYFLKKLL